MYLACYDIENDRLRTKVSDKLLDFGLERIQFSVFVGPLKDSQKDKLSLVIEKIIKDTANSNFLLIPLNAFNNQSILHCGDKAPDWEYLNGNTLTLML
jgi:CRISPR-associated protein Cas2